MKVPEFKRLVSQPGRLNYFVICPDNLGLGLFLDESLKVLAQPADIHHYNAEDITKDRARLIEKEARSAPRAGSELQHIYIYHLQKLASDSVGPLLKAVEEATYARFIFQAQSTPQKIHTLRSRASVIKLAFLSKPEALGYIQKVLKLDARAADELGLYDGTIQGTQTALAMKNAVTQIRRDFAQGLRGAASLFNPEQLKSYAALEVATYDFLTPEERTYLGKMRLASNSRKTLAFYLAMSRI